MSNKESIILGRALKALFKAGLIKEAEEIVDLMTETDLIKEDEPKKQ
jgi:pentatricopeptide repeat protein